MFVRAFDAILIAADLENASNIDQVTLELGIKSIESWHQHFAVLVDECVPFFNPIIDGALVAIPTDLLLDSQNRKQRFDCVVEGCRQWIVATSEAADDLSLRVAIHWSKVLVTKENYGPRIVGKGAAHCSRMVRLAPGKEIVVSEEFVEAWRSFNQNSLRRYFSSKTLYPTSKEPLLFWQKPGLPSQVRFVVDPEQRTPSSAEIRAQLAVENALSLMRELQFDLAFHLAALNAGNAVAGSSNDKANVEKANMEIDGQDEIDPSLFGRISIYRLNPFKQEELQCWLRLERDVQDDEEKDESQLPGSQNDAARVLSLEYPSSTSYSIRPAKGPVGFAFSEKKIQYHWNLPDWNSRSHKKRYREEMEKWNLTAVEISGFRHHARAYLAVPFSESDLSWRSGGDADDGSFTPTGVLCIDWDDPLTTLSNDNDRLKELLDFFSEWLVYRFSFVAACLMREGS